MLMPAPPRAPSRLLSAPTMPPGNTSTSSRMTAPSRPRQNVVWRMTLSCRTVNSAAPTIGPVRVWMPPSSTMTMPSIERETRDTSGRDRALGEGEQAAGDAAEQAGDGEADPVHALDVDADRFRAQRRVAPGPHRIAERREQEAAQQQNPCDAPSASVSR